MLDRAFVVDENFVKTVKENSFQELPISSFNSANISKKLAISLFDSQLKSRHLDLIARNLKEKGLGFYTIGSSGHEGNVAFGEAFSLADFAFLHYRSGAFYLQRAKKHAEVDGVLDVLLSLMAKARDPIAGGRHKVFGSLALNIPPQTSTIASHLPKALGAAFSITRAKELNINGKIDNDSVIICSFGDASFNHASAQTTFNACSFIAENQYPLPIVFICEDNGFGISVPTPKNWIEKSVKAKPHINYIQCNGLDVVDCFEKAQKAIYLARIKKAPVFLHMRCVRLLGHAGSDIEQQYLAQKDIDKTEALDPILQTARMLINDGILDQKKILELYENNRALINAKALSLLNEPGLTSAKQIMGSILPKISTHKVYKNQDESLRQQCFGKAFAELKQKRNMCSNINYALTDILLQYPETIVFGEDVGVKGGVYQVTRELQKRFGKRRVFDTILDETTILGTAIGMAHNGFLPIAEIQFLAYLHNAEDQLRGEAATLSFFSNGQFRNPLILRVPALAYQKGFGGHFHNDNSISVLRDLPGVVVVCPANGSDAVKLLRECVNLALNEGRVIVFLEPIALYMTKDLHEPKDNGWLCTYPSLDEKISLGDVSAFGKGDIAIITYGNGCYLSRQAQKILKTRGINIKIIDIHWLSPIPIDAILKELRGINSVLIVDEGRKSGSVSEGIVTMLIENERADLIVRRLTGEDSFITLGNSWKELLPSTEQIVKAIEDLNVKKESMSGRFIISG